MYYQYNVSSNSTILRFSNIDNFNNTTELLQLISEAKNKAKEKIKQILKSQKNTHKLEKLEKFNDLEIKPPTLITYGPYYKYDNDVNKLQEWLDTNTNKVFSDIQQKLQDFNSNRTQNKTEILNLLTNMYVLNYLYKINTDNAEVYKVYLKYNDPKKNMYYKPYLD